MRAYGRAQAVQCAAVLHRVLHPLKDAERADRRGLSRHARRTSLRHFACTPVAAPALYSQRCATGGTLRVARQVARRHLVLDRVDCTQLAQLLQLELPDAQPLLDDPRTALQMKAHASCKSPWALEYHVST
jgi:hypothetical protein